MVRFVSYNPENEELVVEFPDKHAVYAYHGVPKYVAEGMRYASAFGDQGGVYFQQSVKSAYPFTRL
jgi:hypothetical protein